MMDIGSSKQAVDGSNEFDMDLDRWVSELYNDEFQDSLLNFGLDELININPNEDSQSNISTINNSSGGGSLDKSQSGFPQEMMNVSILTPNNISSTQQRSAHIMSPVPQFVSNPGSTNSHTRRTTDLSQLQYQNQPLRQRAIGHKVGQQPSTHSSMAQPTIISNQKSPSHHQKSHLQNQHQLRQQGIGQLQQRQYPMVQPIQNFQGNQNQTSLQFQQRTGASLILLPEGGQNRVQGIMIGEGQRRTHELRQGSISALLSAPVGFLTPSQFSSNETWREYVYRQVTLMRDRYINEVIIMHKRAALLCTQATSMEIQKKYDSAKEFLEKIMSFLNIPTVDKIPRHNERVYNYMNFIINYMTFFRNKYGDPSQSLNEVISQQPFHQATRSQSEVVINLEANNFNRQPAHQQPSSSQKGPQMPPNGDQMKSQYMLPQNPPLGIANLEASMMNFNQNFPSRRPQGRMPNSPSKGLFQMGTATPLRIGSIQGTPQQSNLGPKTSSNNLSGSSMSSLKAETAAKFPSRQVNHQPPLATQSLNSKKMKPPMHKSNELTESKVAQVVSSLGSLLTSKFPPQSAPEPIIQKATNHSSWQMNANFMLSPEAIARSPFLLGSPSPSNREKGCSSSDVSSSIVENQRPEIPIIAGLLKNQETINRNVSNTGPPRGPTSLPRDNQCTDKNEESGDSKDPHLRLLEAVKSLSSKQFGSSIREIGSVKKDLDRIPDHEEPTIPIGGDVGNFLLKDDNMGPEENFNSIFDSEYVNLDHLNIGEETAFLSDYENKPEQKMKRKLSLTSATPSQPDFGDFGDDDSLDQFFSEEWDIDSTLTSTNKKQKLECKNEVILGDIKEFNTKLLETSLEMVLDPTDEEISKLGGHEGFIVTCMYKNVCCPDLILPRGGDSSQMIRPEFHIQLLVPDEYPASSPRILDGNHNLFSNGPWAELYEDTLSRFKLAVRQLPKKMSLGDVAQNWDVCARAVITEFMQRNGAASFSSRYGTWESFSGSS